ncbi:MAG: hypothetical protein OEZ43_11800 [Gammaproteobacteria bacterium]|nr:hypothetical protein [Gammaproteobacteria bacterium]
MFVVLLRFSGNKARAGELMEGHNQWIAQGFNDGVFLVVGSLQPNQGGAIIAHNITREKLEERISQDPFVTESVVSSEILEIGPTRVDERLQTILG